MTEPTPDETTDDEAAVDDETQPLAIPEGHDEDLDLEDEGIEVEPYPGDGDAQDDGK